MAMKTAWYLVPYKLDYGHLGRNGTPGRVCSMDDFTREIFQAKGGNWSETEVAGDQAIVKVYAEEETLAKIDATFKRLPDDMPTNTEAKALYFKPRLKPLSFDAEQNKYLFDETKPCSPISLEVVDNKVKAE